jgi:hypothetical protein
MQITQNTDAETSSQPVWYITYDENWQITQSYYQVPRPEHLNCMMVVPEEVATNWVMYRINATHDGVELIPPVVPDNNSIMAKYPTAQLILFDQTAIAYGYPDMTTAVTYADEPTAPHYQAEGLALRKWRSQVRNYVDSVVAAVKAGDRLNAPDNNMLFAEIADAVTLELPPPVQN